MRRWLVVGAMGLMSVTPSARSGVDIVPYFGPGLESAAFLVSCTNASSTPRQAVAYQIDGTVFRVDGEYFEVSGIVDSPGMPEMVPPAARLRC